MSEFTIVTDSGCDIAPETLDRWDVRCIDLNFMFRDGEKAYTGRDIPVSRFYQLMREGKVAQTSAANGDTVARFLEPLLREGRDVLYLAFSSGLSSTANNAVLAAEELRAAYPERKILVIDTLAASAGHGLLVYFAVRERENGAGPEETARVIRQYVPKLCHWFTVDDLVYLKRGGRIDPRSAFVATVLNIKPVLHMDDEGHLINMKKVRGRKFAVRALAEKYGELAEDPEHGIYFISHGDCMADALELDAMLYGRFGHHAGLITDIGPIIGAHSGPGTLALFFLGTHR